MIQINAAPPDLPQKAGMDAAFLNPPAADGPPCPSCGRPMRLVRDVPRLGGLPQLHTYACRACGVSYTEAIEPGLKSDLVWIES